MPLISKVKRALPWWTRLAAKIVLARVPISYATWAKIGLYRHGHMDGSEYALSVFESHVRRLGLSLDQLSGTVILEIGPGDSCATAIIAHAYGASAILIDADRFANSDPMAYEPICRALRERGLSPVDVAQMPNFEALLAGVGARYVTSGLSSWRDLSPKTVDIVFSQAVLEHIRAHEFVELQKECFRVMKHGGKASHRVDLKDHLGGGLNNLRFSARVWESDLFVDSGFYTNRIRFDQMLESFDRAGFIVSDVECDRWDQLPVGRQKLDVAYRDLPDSSLLVNGFSCVLLRP